MSRDSRPQARSHAARLWAAIAVLALAVLVFACRGAPLGTAVADDYIFLYQLKLVPPVNLLDSMGAAFYWRPLSRQLYFLLVGPWLLTAPWAVALIHGALLLATSAVVWRLMCRSFSPTIAAAIATFPILAEPVRVLLAWPSGAQYLIGLLAVVIGLQAAAAGRLAGAALAAIAALLSHELGAILLPTMPLISWFRSRNRRTAMQWAGVAVAIALAWVAVLWAADIAWPSRSAMPSGLSLGEVGQVILSSLRAQLNLEDLGSVSRWLFLLGYTVLGVLGLWMATARTVRKRLRAARPLLLGGLVWFIACTLPLTFAQPWNAWRSTFAGVGLGVALTGALGLVRPTLAWAFVGLRCVALCLAPSAPALVSPMPPETESQISFTRLVRLQRTVDATRSVLLERFPTLAAATQVRRFYVPRMTEVGFDGDSSLRVWYGDSTLSWRGSTTEQADITVQYSPGRPELAAVLEPEALELFSRAKEAFGSQRYDAADSLLVSALDAQAPHAPYFLALLCDHRARIAYNVGDFARADSLNRLDLELGGGSSDQAALAAILALRRGDTLTATRRVDECLSWDPSHPEGRALARTLRRRGP